MIFLILLFIVFIYLYQSQSNQLSLSLLNKIIDINSMIEQPLDPNLKDAHHQHQTHINPQQLHHLPQNQQIIHKQTSKHQHEPIQKQEVHVIHKQKQQALEKSHDNEQKIKENEHHQKVKVDDSNGQKHEDQLKSNQHQQIINPSQESIGEKHAQPTDMHKNPSHFIIQKQPQIRQNKQHQLPPSHQHHQQTKQEGQKSIKNEGNQAENPTNEQHTHQQEIIHQLEHIKIQQKQKQNQEQHAEQKKQQENEEKHAQNIIPTEHQHVENTNNDHQHKETQKEHQQPFENEKQEKQDQNNGEQENVNRDQIQKEGKEKQQIQKQSNANQEVNEINQEQGNAFIFTPDDRFQKEENQNEQKEQEQNIVNAEKGHQNQQQEINQKQTQKLKEQEKIDDDDKQIDKVQEEGKQNENQNEKQIELSKENEQIKQEKEQIKNDKQEEQAKKIEKENEIEIQNQNTPSSYQNEQKDNVELNVHEPAIKQEQTNIKHEQKQSVEEGFTLPRLPTLKLTTEIPQDSDQQEGKQKNNKQQLVEFIEYQPQNHIQKPQNNENQVKIQEQHNDENNTQPKVHASPQFQHIKNQEIRSKLEQLETKFESIKQPPQNQPQNQQPSQTQQIAKPHRQVVHEKSVHNIVEDLHRVDNDKKHRPVYQPMRRRNNKDIDLTKIDLKMGLASNLINVTIGEVICREVDIQTETLVQQIQNLKKKLQEVERKNQLFQKEQTIERQKEREKEIQNAKGNQFKISRSKNPFFGRIYRKSEINNSRVSDSSQTFNQDYNHFATFTQMKKVEARDKNRFSSTMGFRNPQQQAQLQVNKSFHSNFRVKKQLRQAPPSQSDQTDEKQIGFIKNMHSNSKLQFSNEEKIDLQSKNESRTYQFSPNFRQEAEQQCIFIPENPPQSSWKQYDLIEFAKQAFLKFGVNIYQSQGTTLHVKKYKNCVSFILDEQRTILWYYDGRFYFGGWRVNENGQGQKAGYGYEYVPEKYIYVGTFEENRRNGEGLMKMLSKQKDVIYAGQWVNGLKQGIGRQSQADDVQYIGEWKEGKKHGFGKIKISQTQSFQGCFKKGIKNGKGTQKFKNGDTYSGQYLNGKFNGNGTYIWSNNSMYQGQFQNGLRCGHGLWKSNIHQEAYDSYDGEYKNDKKDGFGIYKWKDGNIYEGQFMNDLKHGQGQVKYKDGKIMKYKWSQGNPITKIGDKTDKASSRSRKSSAKNPQDSFTQKNEQFTDKSKGTAKYRVSQSKSKPRQSAKLYHM